MSDTFRKVATHGHAALGYRTPLKSNCNAVLQKGEYMYVTLHVRHSPQMSHYWAHVALSAKTKTAARRSNRITTLFLLREKKRKDTACRMGLRQPVKMALIEFDLYQHTTATRRNNTL